MLGSDRRRRRLALGMLAPAGLAIAPLPVAAQTPPPAPPQATDTLDPNSPMSAFPDIGVAWPDLNQAPADPAETIAERAAIVSDVRYTYKVDGIDGIGSALLHERFDAESSLRANKGEPANAPQLERRARARTPNCSKRCSRPRDITTRASPRGSRPRAPPPPSRWMPRRGRSIDSPG